MLMAEQYWAACRTFTGREHVVRAKIEELDRGAFLPTYVRSWVSGGKLSAAERAGVAGYVFFRSSQDDWPPVQGVDGVIGVLLDGDRAARISSGNMARLVLDHADGANNRFDGCISAPSRSGRRKTRKPRPSKRARFK
jgi:transcriptional antiterminator NusG